jgi:hypothetical protein
MDELLKKIGLAGIVSFRLENGADCYICNVDGDKIILLLEIDSLDTIKMVTHSIPELKELIYNATDNPHNKEAVDQERIPLAKFLWDLYVIGLHRISLERTPFDQLDISQLERDRYAARKLVIEYENDEELEGHLTRIIYPHRELDLYDDSGENEEKVIMEGLVQDTDHELIKDETKTEADELSFEALFAFLKKVRSSLQEPNGGEPV